MKYGKVAAIALAAIALASAVVLIDYDDGSDESAAEEWNTVTDYSYLEFNVIDTTNNYVEVRFAGMDSLEEGYLPSTLEIPSTFVYDSTTYTVTAIADNGFSGYDFGDSGIKLPTTLTSIGDYAFANS